MTATKTKTQNRAILAKFLDDLVQAAAQTTSDVPFVYRDVCLDILLHLREDKMLTAVNQLANDYRREMPKLTPCDDVEIPF